MKVNQLGILAIIGVVVSVTAACTGSPTKPSSTDPSFGDAASAASVNLSTPKPVGAADQICAGQPQTLGESEDQTGGGPNPDAPPVLCDSSAAGDQPHGDVMVGDGSSMDSARFAHRLHR